MKLQGFSIIFALIVLPLIIVISYYIQLQVDTIALQNSYDYKLLDATYDSLSAFEINTANEDLSSVSDSLRTIVEASCSVFFNTLSSNLGMSNASKSYVEPYVPALLFTLYDGYYIYAPTQVPTVLTNEDGVALSVGDVAVSCPAGNGIYSFEGESATGRSEYEQYREYLKQIENGDYTNRAIVDTYKINHTLKYSELGPDNKADYGQILFKLNGGANRYSCDINHPDIYLENKNVLKSYIPYSARYQGSNYNIIVTYSLDNFVTIEGYIQGVDLNSVYYTRSGYLIPSDAVDIATSSTRVNDDGTSETVNLNLFSEEDAEKFIKSRNSSVSITINESTPITLTCPNESFDELNERLTIQKNKMRLLEDISYGLNDPKTLNQLSQFTLSTPLPATTDINILKPYARGEMVVTQQEINNLTYSLQLMDSVIFYTKAKLFSTWVQTNLSNVRINTIQEVTTLDYATVNETDTVRADFSSNDCIFDVGTVSADIDYNGVTEPDFSTPFVTHKLAVIQNSIQYNLNLAMSTYNQNTAVGYNYQMPVLSGDEWERILTNISIVSFMQGYNCGLKQYNNYQIASSVNNEVSVSTDYIYFVNKDKFSNETDEYHKIDCSRLIKEDTNIDMEGDNIDKQISEITQVPNAEYISFLSKDVKYDKNHDTKDKFYYYDHKNLSCYKCILDANYQVYNDNKTDIYHYNAIFDNSLSSYSSFANLRKAYYLGVGNAKYNLYKMNAFDKSYGYQSIFKRNLAQAYSMDNINMSDSTRPIKDMRSVEIVIGKLRVRDSNESSIRFKILCNNIELTGKNKIYSIPSNSTRNTTILVDVDPATTITGNMSVGKLFFDYDINGGGSTPLTSTMFMLPDSDDNCLIGKDAGSYRSKFNEIIHQSVNFVKVIYK